VCVVDEDFARRYWPKGGALGQRVFPGADPDEAKFLTIVGVVGAVKQADFTESQGQGAVYVPFRDWDSGNIFVVTRTSQRFDAFADSLRQAIRATEPELAIGEIRSMDMRISERLTMRRSPAMLAGIVAVVALLLAAIGTYGVVAYTIAQRQREIGIRVALGAQIRQIQTQFLSLGLRLVSVSTLLGIVGVWIAGKAMQSVLFGVPTIHLASLIASALVIAAVSLIACLIPARRASRIDPVTALRAE